MAKNISELPIMERLAIEQALFSRLGEDVSTKNPDSLRSFADEQVVGNYYATGAKSYDLSVNGQKVGTYSIRVSKGKAETKKQTLQVTDGAVLEQYIQLECADAAVEYAQLMSRNFAEFMLQTYGVVCDGCEVVDVVTPAEPSCVLGTTLRVDAEKVGSALVGYLPTTVAGLLGGGEDEV